MKKTPSLEDDLWAAFARACDEQDFEAAEHLFRALEAIARRDDGDEKLRRAHGRMLAAFRRNTS